ncbi:hypothetical protein F2Q70_00030145 [Brassica cretica]|uniref:Uncharacterized protein n=1 Tax=Brassica cretica TaxID=69181 RepID=A0A8S9FQZ6_BRACR|nr:hypothetical protein F2Q70_00030145 [Brassica cretica]
MQSKESANVRINCSNGIDFQDSCKLALQKQRCLEIRRGKLGTCFLDETTLDCYRRPSTKISSSESMAVSPAIKEELDHGDAKGRFREAIPPEQSRSHVFCFD